MSACAVCDGALPMFRNRPLFVVGGGDSAMEEAHFLTKFASKVYIVHRRDELRASAIMQERAKHNPKIELLALAQDRRRRGRQRGRAGPRSTISSRSRETTMAAAGLFFAIGHVPNTAFLGGQVKCDDQGYIVTTPGTTQTAFRACSRPAIARTRSIARRSRQPEPAAWPRSRPSSSSRTTRTRSARSRNVCRLRAGFPACHTRYIP